MKKPRMFSKYGNNFIEDDFKVGKLEIRSDLKKLSRENDCDSMKSGIHLKSDEESCNLNKKRGFGRNTSFQNKVIKKKKVNEAISGFMKYCKTQWNKCPEGLQDEIQMSKIVNDSPMEEDKFLSEEQQKEGKIELEETERKETAISPNLERLLSNPNFLRFTPEEKNLTIESMIDILESYSETNIANGKNINININISEGQEPLNNNEPKPLFPISATHAALAYYIYMKTIQYPRENNNINPNININNNPKEKGKKPQLEVEKGIEKNNQVQVNPPNEIEKKVTKHFNEEKLEFKMNKDNQNN